MKILVDADACPVKDEIVRIAKQHSLKVLFYCDTAHRIDIPGTQTILVDKGRDSADIKLANAIEPGDFVITQDYGLASMAMAKRAIVLSANGREYTLFNIDQLLFERHLSMKERKAGNRIKGPSKRTQEDNKIFEEALKRRLQDEQNR